MNNNHFTKLLSITEVVLPMLAEINLKEVPHQIDIDIVNLEIALKKLKLDITKIHLDDMKSALEKT